MSFVDLKDVVTVGNDATQAIRDALAAGSQILCDESYIVKSTIELPNGFSIFGSGKLTYVIPQSQSGTMFRGTGLTRGSLYGIELEFVNEGTFSSFVPLVHFLNSSGIFLGDLRINNGRRNGVRFEGCSRVRMVGGWAKNTAGVGVALDNTHESLVEDVELDGNASFGCHLTNTSQRNIMRGLRCESNGIELVGIVTGCTRNLVEGCFAKGTGDNGISITGDYNRAIGNHCELNAHSGIGVYGSYNTIVGNTCLANGTDPASMASFSGITVTPLGGGAASFNEINGNVCDDYQEVMTQKSSFRVGVVNGVPGKGNRFVGNVAGRSVNGPLDIAVADPPNEWI